MVGRSTRSCDIYNNGANIKEEILESNVPITMDMFM